MWKFVYVIEVAEERPYVYRLLNPSTPKIEGEAVDRVYKKRGSWVGTAGFVGGMWFCKGMYGTKYVLDREYRTVYLERMNGRTNRSARHGERSSKEGKITTMRIVGSRSYPQLPGHLPVLTFKTAPQQMCSRLDMCEADALRNIHLWSYFNLSGTKSTRLSLATGCFSIVNGQGWIAFSLRYAAPTSDETKAGSRMPTRPIRIYPSFCFKSPSQPKGLPQLSATAAKNW